jgi:DNA repair protein RecO (recombination protein O)
MIKTTRALVLREVKFKEADKMLTVLTEDEGKLSVRARGALRKGSRCAAATGFLTFSELTLFGNRGRWSLNEASAVEQFMGLREDISRLALASYFAELLEAVSDADSPNPEMLQLGLNSLFALSRSLYEPAHIKAVFEMRLMCLAGYEPFLDGCPACGSVDITDKLFSLNGGAVHCRSCRPDSAGVSLPLCPDSLAALRHIVSADPKRIFSFSLEGEAQKRLADICEAYVPAQLERGFSTLDYWKHVV